MKSFNRDAFITRHATGETQGKDPRVLPTNLLKELGHPETPIAAIRANCIECSGGSVGEARKCQSLLCPLWAFRMGINPFHGNASVRSAPPSQDLLSSENQSKLPANQAANGVGGAGE
jgi:hypothetical protein